MKKTLVVLFVLVSIVMMTVGCSQKYYDDQAILKRFSVLTEAKEAYEQGRNDFGFFYGTWWQGSGENNRTYPWYAQSNSDGLVSFCFVGSLPSKWTMFLNLTENAKGRQWLARDRRMGRREVLSTLVETSSWLDEKENQFEAVKELVGLILSAAKRAEIDGANVEFDAYIR